MRIIYVVYALNQPLEPEAVQCFAYQTAVALRVQVVCSYLYRRRLTATAGKTGLPGGHALSGSKLCS